MKKVENRYYGNVAREYNQRRASSERWQLEDVAVRKFMAGNEGKSVLDVPVGTGRFVPLYRDMNNKMVGIDRSAEMLLEAEGEAQSVGYPQGEYIEADVMDIGKLGVRCSIGICMRFMNWLPAASAEKAFALIAEASTEQVIVGITTIDEDEFEGVARERVETRLANAHSKPMSEGLPPNGPHSAVAFRKWIRDANLSIADTFTTVEGKNHLFNKVYHLVR